MNTGCIPTKALVRSAEIAHIVRSARRFGVNLEAGFEVDLDAVMDRKERIVGKIIERMESGMRANPRLTIIRGEARFVGPTELSVDGTPLQAKRVIIATGSRPSVPPIPGLAAAGYLTSDDMVYLRRQPSRLVVIGGGAVGLGHRCDERRSHDGRVPRLDVHPPHVHRGCPIGGGGRLVERAAEDDTLSACAGPPRAARRARGAML